MLKIFVRIATVITGAWAIFNGFMAIMVARGASEATSINEYGQNMGQVAMDYANNGIVAIGVAALLAAASHIIDERS